MEDVCFQRQQFVFIVSLEVCAQSTESQPQGGNQCVPLHCFHQQLLLRLLGRISCASDSTVNKNTGLCHMILCADCVECVIVFSLNHGPLMLALLMR